MKTSASSGETSSEKRRGRSHDRARSCSSWCSSSFCIAPDAMEQDPSGGRGANRLVVQTRRTGPSCRSPNGSGSSRSRGRRRIAGDWFGGVTRTTGPRTFGQLSADPEVSRQDFRRRDDRSCSERGVESDARRIRRRREARREVRMEKGGPGSSYAERTYRSRSTPSPRKIQRG